MNDKVCIDASLVLTWLLPEQGSDRIDALFSEWDKKGLRLLSPPLFDAEVTSVIRQQVYLKKLQPEQGDHVFSVYLRMAIERVDGQEIYKRAWELAKRFDLPRTYDMQYLAVAELKDCELWTNDKRLVNSLQGKAPRIKWVGEYDFRRQV